MFVGVCVSHLEVIIDFQNELDISNIVKKLIDVIKTGCVISGVRKFWIFPPSNEINILVFNVEKKRAVSFPVSGNLEFLLLRSPCKNLESYITPSGVLIMVVRRTRRCKNAKLPFRTPERTTSHFYSYKKGTPEMTQPVFLHL